MLKMDLTEDFSCILSLFSVFVRDGEALRVSTCNKGSFFVYKDVHVGVES